ncbi:alpha/beta hydrolase [Mesorhizobium sp.]|uniref:alpha/beta fold hydrolase n=1 Tax=Mesorhizobium sp. TaxID=1871066 RepID=UPI000FE7A7C2|nr:alpha/beta hydrolase [Mesorhizobium sp.]RWD81237.1 MAG: alpha/beta hydrolase [Mesorhizobium sp.]RWE66886.1 MAG: alpha/beta hydrolase [Mesorhizobium sp.]RWF02312.1 MAG: alpha/beta hydrolase [Mesorhizobium sp.]RWF56695.1 MAG: alpha/beta hydrolase [Mesorhizobium sp.]TIS41811.1 MAG: alpha/beta hydrolase [Mesorhizobium sp.]
MIAGCGHWSQQEKPEGVTALMLDWLKRRFPRIAIERLASDCDIKGGFATVAAGEGSEQA